MAQPRELQDKHLKLNSIWCGKHWGLRRSTVEYGDRRLLLLGGILSELLRELSHSQVEKSNILVENRAARGAMVNTGDKWE